MVFNATFKNISVISWQLVLLVEETGEPGENHRPVTSHWQTLLHNVVSHIYNVQSNLSIATIEGSSENRSHKTGSRWIEVMIFAHKISRGKT